MDKDQKLVETYKLARGSVEHFDAILGDIRKNIFTFNGIFLSTGIAYFLRTAVNTDIRYIEFFLLSNLFAAINFLVWLLEKHYHRYLFISACIGKNLEIDLFENNPKKHLTLQLERASSFSLKNKHLFCLEKIFKLTCKPYDLIRLLKIRIYDLLYLLPIFCAESFCIFLGNLSKGTLQGNPCDKWLIPISWTLFSIYFFIVIGVIAYNHYFEKHFKFEFKQIENQK